MNFSTAPVALFVYNRPLHTAKVVEALLKNEFASLTDLYIFSDGPKSNASLEQVNIINELRCYLKTIRGFNKVEIIEQKRNLGLANSVIAGVSSVVNKHGKVIVLEDDIITSPYFLKYMNDGLDIYKDNPDVISIHAYNYPVNPEDLPETFFMRGADCWGWATWDRGWKLFDKDSKKLYDEIVKRGLEYDLDLEGSYPFSQMLLNQINGTIDSWAIRWHASAFLKNKFTLYPRVSLIYNIGFDNSGTHSGEVDTSNNINWNNKFPVSIQPVTKLENNKIALNK